MATTNKDFKVKNGLIVEGANATVNGNEVLTNAASINALSDVTISSPTSGEVLKWNGSAWVNDTGGTGGGISNVVEDTTPQLGGDLDAQSFNIANVNSFTLDTTPTSVPATVGTFSWDSANETAQLLLDGVTLQIGQEHVIRVKNASGTTTIPDRTVVMFAGATGDTVTVQPAISSNVAVYPSDYIVGITTEDILADDFGFVTQFGFINHVNTTAWTVGTLLYPDPANAGGLTSTRPTAPAWQTPIAAVTKQNGSSGRILVRTIPGIRINNVEGVELTTPTTDDILRVNASGIVVNSNLSSSNIANLAATTNIFSGNVSAKNITIYDSYGIPEYYTKITSNSISAYSNDGTSEIESDLWLNINNGNVSVGSGLFSASNVNVINHINTYSINVSSDIHSNTITTTGIADVSSLSVGRYDTYWSGATFGNPSSAMTTSLSFFSSGYGNYSDAQIKVSGGANAIDNMATLILSAGIVDFQSNVTFAAANVIGNVTLAGGNISGINKLTATNSVKAPIISYYGTGNTAYVYTDVENVKIGLGANIISIGDDAFNTGTTLINNDLKLTGSYLIASDNAAIYKTDIDTFGKSTLATTFRGIFTGNGSSLSNVNASNLSSGTVSSDRLPLANATANGIVNISSQTFSGDKTFNNNISIAGNLTVTGTTTTVSATNLEISDPLIYIGTGNSGNLYDLGFVGHFNNGTYQHTGFIRDATDGIWKLFSNVTTEPTGNTAIDFTNAVYDNILVGNVAASRVNVTGQLVSTVATGTAPLSVTSTTKVTNLNADLLDGYNSDTGITANTVVVRDSNSSISVNNINLGTGTYGNVSADYLKLVSGYDLNITAGAAIAGTIKLNSNTTYTTHSAGTNNNTLATTAYVDTAVSAASAPLSPFLLMGA